MNARPKAPKHGRIDKAALGEPVPVYDPVYRESFKGRVCEACGAWSDTVVGAHVNPLEVSGTGNKCSDELIVGLCSDCHDEADRRRIEDQRMSVELMEKYTGIWFWYEKVFKRMLRNRYWDQK